jgi:selenocysteine-specific elongation factor
MKYLTIGVIGHVDHGKTTLVKTLTGVDTDRLKEEKERGISIALGYAYLDLPNGKLGVVDVPGHEKFIRTMISGATGIKAVLLVLDVNEGVKPQTIEHIQIAQLLGIKHGVVGITKCDTADADMRELASLDIQEYLEGTFLENAPIVYISSQSGEGLDELKEIFSGFLDSVKPIDKIGLPYLPVDRAFSLSGFGKIVTGTLRRGAISLDDELVVHPTGEQVRIRELQTHGEQVESVEPGTRTAVNIRGGNKLELKRGYALAPEGTLQSGLFATAMLTLISDREISIKQRQQVRVLWGTNEVVARVHILGADMIVSGETCTCQIMFESPVCSMFRERAIIRSYSPVETIGGAVLLEYTGKRYKRTDKSAVRHTEILHSGTPKEVLGEAIFASPNGIFPRAWANARYGFPDSGLGKKYVDIGNKMLAHPDKVAEAEEMLQGFLQGYHELNPTQWGPSEEQVLIQIKSPFDNQLVRYALHDLVGSKTITITQGLVHLADHRAGGALTDEEQAIVQEIEDAFRAGGLHPPGIVDILMNDKERMRLYRYLIDKNTLHATWVANKPKTVSNTIVFHHETLENATKYLQNAIPPNQPFTPSDAKEHIQTSRKYLIPLLECLDKQGITKRQGDGRIIAE